MDKLPSTAEIAAPLVSAQLDEINKIAALAASIAPEHRWLDAAMVGAMLGYSARQVVERIACREDFPKALKLRGGRPRWNAAEVALWARQQRDRAA